MQILPLTTDIDICLVSSVTFPFIHSNSIELYFLRSRLYKAWSSAHSERRDKKVYTKVCQFFGPPCIRNIYANETLLLSAHYNYTTKTNSFGQEITLSSF